MAISLSSTNSGIIHPKRAQSLIKGPLIDRMLGCIILVLGSDYKGLLLALIFPALRPLPYTLNLKP